MPAGVRARGHRCECGLNALETRNGASAGLGLVSSVDAAGYQTSEIIKLGSWPSLIGLGWGLRMCLIPDSQAGPDRLV